MERQLYGTIKMVFGPRKNISEKFQEALPGGLGQHTKLQNSIVSKATTHKYQNIQPCLKQSSIKRNLFLKKFNKSNLIYNMNEINNQAWYTLALTKYCIFLEVVT